MRRLLLPALVVCLGLLAASPASARTIKSIWGPTTLPNGKPAAPVYRDLGVDDVQVGLSWAAIAPSRPASPRNFRDPAYVWPADVQRLVRDGRRFGFKVSILLSGSPAWANGGHSSNFAPTNPRDFARFAFAASKRFGRVHRWMIWGEPGRAAQWQPLPPNRPTAPRRYARLLDATYGQLKRASRRNVVIGGMTFTVGDVQPKDWIRWMRLPNGKPPRLDMWGHNPFSTRFPNLSDGPIAPKAYDFNDIDRLERDVHRVYGRAYPRRFRRSGPKIWVSEFTIQADHGSQDFNFFVSKRVQARWVAAAFREANKARYIAGLGWLGLLDEPPAPFNRTTGLMTFSLHKKPAYRAYQRAK